MSTNGNPSPANLSQGRADSPPLQLPSGGPGSARGRHRSQENVVQSSQRPRSRSRRRSGIPLPSDGVGYRTPLRGGEPEELVPIPDLANTPISNMVRSDLYRGTPRIARRRSNPATPADGNPAAPGATPSGAATSDRITADHAYVWGTTVSIDDVERRFKRFVESYSDPGSDTAKYYDLLHDCLRHDKLVLNIDCNNVQSFDAELYRQLVHYPMEVIPICDLVIRNISAAIQGGTEEEAPLIQIRPFHLGEARPMRDLNPSDIDKLVCIRGMITRMSMIIPDLKTAFFKCEVCGKTETSFSDRGRIDEPTKCPNCQGSFTMRLVHNRSKFANKQLIKMQETPDAIPEGETPHAVTLYAFEDLVDSTKPGDRVEVVGVYRAVPLRVSQKIRTLKAVYRTYLDVIHVRRMDAPGKKANETSLADVLVNKSDDHDLTGEQIDARIDEIKALASEGDFESLYNRLSRSLAPSIHELDDVKKGVLCQLFGGLSKEFTGGRIRGELNCLLIGDPGVSKSQLLGYVHKIAPRGIYTSGRGSSAVGLTAYVTRDPDSRELVLESGALVLSDLGVCCIDEFDKMSDSARSMLHEVMEQQTVSVAKAGIVCSLNARTSVLASANPKESRYNPNMSVIENLQLPPSLLSRFDLIYLVLDKQDEKKDRELARHLVSLFWEQPPAHVQSLVTPQLLRDYIAYARETIKPRISDEAQAQLVSEYKTLRASGASRKVVSATPRQLESLVRLSEALARMELNPRVEVKHVSEAVRLFKAAMQESALDPVTGCIDMSMINTGLSSSILLRRDGVAQEILRLLAAKPGRSSFVREARDEMVRANGEDCPEVLMEAAVKMLEGEGRIRRQGHMIALLGGGGAGGGGAAADVGDDM